MKSIKLFDNKNFSLLLKVNRSITKKETILRKHITFFDRTIKLLGPKRYYSAITDRKSLQEYIEEHYSGEDESHEIIYLIKEDFDKICFYNYKKYRNGKNGFKAKHLELEDFSSECYFHFLNGLNKRNESIRKIASNPKQFISIFIKTKALDMIRGNNPEIKEFDSDIIDVVLESGKSAIDGAGEYKNPEDELLHGETRLIILRALRKLSDKDQFILEMRFLEDINPSKISSILGISITKVYDRIKYAKKKLKTELVKSDIEILLE